MNQALYESSITSLPLLGRGKVRDIYAVDDDKLLIITSDRISAFDVILNDPIEKKGEILTKLTIFWLKKLSNIVPNHLTDINPEDVVKPHERSQIINRSMVVKRLQPVLIEAVARGYLIGSGWKEYKASGKVCGETLPKNLQQAEALERPIFTPAEKASIGMHDENIDFNRMIELVGIEAAEKIRDLTLILYKNGSTYAVEKGIIIADTKFEFGFDKNGILHLMDEVLTPDSSRFWPVKSYVKDSNPPSFDKQFIRDWLENQDWNKKSPAPKVPNEILSLTSKKYLEVYKLLTT